MVEGGMTCVKYLLFAFNLLFFLIGLILIIAGAVIQVQFQEYFDIIGTEFSDVAIFLVVLGVIIFIIGFFGCCGAWKENRCMILTFASLLVLIFILEFAAGIAGFVLRGKVEQVAKDGLQKSLDNYDNATADRQMWDSMQQGLQCCGVEGYADWTGKISPTQTYPKSCCKKSDETKPGCGTAPGLAYPTGCFPALESFIQHNLVAIGVIGLIVALIQIVGILLACCLGREIAKEYESV